MTSLAVLTSRKEEGIWKRGPGIGYWDVYSRYMPHEMKAPNIDPNYLTVQLCLRLSSDKMADFEVEGNIASLTGARFCNTCGQDVHDDDV